MKSRKAKVKICPICTGEFIPFKSTDKVDSPQCAIELKRQKGIKAEAKAERKVDLLRKKVFYANDLKTRKAAAKKACHDYIRLRDVGNKCICCAKEMTGQIHAGHYLESGNNPQIRFDEDNIHSQKAQCNTFQGGNSDDYRGNLIKKIGLERVERLDGMRGGTVKRTCEDYKTIEYYYKGKIKELDN